MVINVKNALKNEGELFPICEDFSFTPEDFQGKVVFRAVHVDAQYGCVGGDIELSGTITAQLELICARCLEPFIKDVICPLEERFSHEASDDVLPISAADTIEIDRCICNSILMSLELLRICTPQCKGLCPVCGVNRNQVSCSCSQSKPEKDNPFSVLQGLLNNEEV